MLGASDLDACIRSDPRVGAARISLAAPGTPTRIIRILDVIAPLHKVSGEGACFPGFLGPTGRVGQGVTHRLEGVTVMTTGTMGADRGAESGLRTTREQVVDMSGPAADYSPFSTTWNLVLEVDGREGLSIDETDDMVRLAGLRVAGLLGSLSAGLAPDFTETYELTDPPRTLPRTVYICQTQSDGVTRHTFLYGQDLYRTRPVFLHPNELLDGALVSGAFAAQRIPTLIHCTSRVVEELYRRHGADLDFAGVILTEGSFVSEADKSRNAFHVARLARALGARGAVLTQQAGGNSMLDQMLMCRYCEEMGIATVVITFEMGGETGGDVPLLFCAPEANAMVSTGNREALVRMPAMERVLGGKTILFTDIDAAAGFDLPVRDIASATDQSGSWRLRAVEHGPCGNGAPVP
jgi:glycine reductase